MNYWEVQQRTVLNLQELGFKYRLNDRIPIFQLWLRLIKMGKKSPKLRPTISRVLDDLDLMKELRLQGLEPPLKAKDRYANL